MAARRKKKSNPTLIFVIIAAVGLLVAYLYQQNQKKNAAKSTASSTASSGLATTNMPTSLAIPIQQSNAYSRTPTIQNFTTATATASSAPAHTSFHHKQPWGPMHPPRER
jgi:beta-mannanase